MIISDEQVRLALGYLQSAHEERKSAPVDSGVFATPELVERVLVRLDSVPETREDRMDEAREVLAHAGFDSDEVANKLIGRAISDSIR